MNEGLLSKNELTLCAVSGGVDSMYLLCRLRELGYPVAAAHYNHRLRGAQADRDERFVRDFCAAEAVPFYAGSGDVAGFAAQNRLGTEEAARIMRYAFLEDCADKLGAARIATAHTADDNAETVLLNLARGAGLRGLCGIPPQRGRVVRPMLEVTRAEAEEYLFKHGVPHVEDATNAGDDYARNRVRHGAVPTLRTVNPAFARTASRNALLLRADEEYLASQAEAFVRAHGANGALDARALNRAPYAVASRAVRIMAGRALSAAHVQAVLSAAKNGGAADVPGLRVELRGDDLLFGAAEPEKLPERTFAAGDALALPEAGLLLESEILTVCPEIHSTFNTFFFQCENICGKLSVAARRDGETMRPAGRNCTKPVRRLLAQAGVPAALRDSVPVLRDEAGILGVYGVGTAQRACARPGDENILKIKFVRLPPDGEQV